MCFPNKRVHRKIRKNPNKEWKNALKMSKIITIFIYLKNFKFSLYFIFLLPQLMEQLRKKESSVSLVGKMSYEIFFSK